MFLASGQLPPVTTNPPEGWMVLVEYGPTGLAFLVIGGLGLLLWKFVPLHLKSSQAQAQAMASCATQISNCATQIDEQRRQHAEEHRSHMAHSERLGESLDRLRDTVSQQNLEARRRNGGS